MRPAPVAWPSVGLAPHSWPSPRRPQTRWPTPSARLSRSSASPVAPGSYTLTRAGPWPGKRRRSKHALLVPQRRTWDLPYLGAEQCRVISGLLYITKSVESRLYSLYDCLRIARGSREETLQVEQPELGSLTITTFVRAVGIEQKGITCHKLLLFLVIDKRLLHAEGNVQRCA